MPSMPPKVARTENRESARASDVERGPSPAERVSGIEKVGGPTGVRFPVHSHPDKSVVSKGKLKD